MKTNRKRTIRNGISQKKRSKTRRKENERKYGSLRIKMMKDWSGHAQEDGRKTKTRERQRR